MTHMGKRSAVRTESRESVYPSDLGLGVGPTSPLTTDRNSGACPPDSIHTTDENSTSLSQPKKGREFEGRALIGAESAVQSCLVPRENNRNNETAEYISRCVNRKNELGRKWYCGAYSLVGKPVEGGASDVLRVNCKCWDCPYCGKKRAKAYRKGIRAAAEEHRLSRFLTLTLDPSKIEGDPIRYLRETFNKFRVYLHRKFGNAPKYIAVVELQKNGNPHLHILIDRYIEQAWIKSAWEAIGGGYKVDIRFVDVHRVSIYVSKYLTDELLFSAPAGTRRITCSRSIKLLRKIAKTHTWRFLKTPIFHLYDRLFVISTNAEFDEEKFLKRFSIQPKTEAVQ